MRRGRLIRLTDEDAMTPEETAAVRIGFSTQTGFDANRIPPKKMLIHHQFDRQ
jgi:hypothetical protein